MPVTYYHDMIGAHENSTRGEQKTERLPGILNGGAKDDEFPIRKSAANSPSSASDSSDIISPSLISPLSERSIS